MLLLILVALASLLFYWVFLKPQTYWSKRNVKHDAGIPIFGSFFKIVMQTENTKGLTERIYYRFPEERYCGFYQMLTPILLVKDPDLIKQIAVKDFDMFQDHNIFSREDVDPLWGKNLISRKGEKWREMRSALSPTFTGSKMKAMFSLITECSQNFVKYFLDKNEAIITTEMKDTFSRYANDVIATCAFGVSCDSLRDRENEFYLTGIDATDLGGIKGLKLILPPFIMKKTEDTIALRVEKGIVRPDMIHLLLEERRRRRNELTNEDITAQVLNFFFAGFEATSSFMVFMAYELALKAEVNEALEECNGKITYDALMNMKYLDMVVNETLRKWPGFFTTDRIATKDYKIPAKNPGEHDIIIEKGTNIWLPIIALQRDPQYYPNPDKFDPERFSVENKDDINPGANIAFGIGPRFCIGNRFALMETKALIFQILTRFEFVPVGKTKIPAVISKKNFNLYSEGGMWLGMKRRDIEVNGERAKY